MEKEGKDRGGDEERIGIGRRGRKGEGGRKRESERGEAFDLTQLEDFVTLKWPGSFLYCAGHWCRY